MADSPQPGSPGGGGTAAQLAAAAERAAAAGRAGLAAIAARRGMPLAVIGAGVVALAWVGERDSAWGFPMLLVGAAMIGLGLIGPRLSGSLALRWGEDGALLQLTGVVAPPGRRRPAPELPAAPDERAPGEPDRVVPPTEIEGESETIEVSVGAVRDGAEPAAEGGEARASPYSA